MQSQIGPFADCNEGTEWKIFEEIEQWWRMQQWENRSLFFQTFYLIKLAYKLLFFVRSESAHSDVYFKMSHENLAFVILHTHIQWQSTTFWLNASVQIDVDCISKDNVGIVVHLMNSLCTLPEHKHHCLHYHIANM